MGHLFVEFQAQVVSFEGMMWPDVIVLSEPFSDDGPSLLDD